MDYRIEAESWYEEARNAGGSDPAVMAIAATMAAQTEMIAQIRDQERTRASEEYNRGYANARDQFQDWDKLYDADQTVKNLREKLQAMDSVAEKIASDQPELDVRRLLGILREQPIPDLTLEEPDPGRDWTRVEAHLFKPSGKWMYRVRLDYTGERHTGSPGEGPSGWHFDGSGMAKRALARATAGGTSGVTIRHLGKFWTMFVQDPPQGYPIWVQPDEVH